MTVEEGHVLNIDGSASTQAANNSTSSPTAAANSSNATSGAAAANKYKSNDRAVSGVGRGSATFQTTVTSSDMEDGGPNGNQDAPLTADRVSVMSGASGRSKTTSQLEAAAKLPWYRGVTCKDIRDIMPTVLILIGGLLIMIFVIPYAFSSVIKQLEMEDRLQAISEETKRKQEEEARKKAAEAAAAAAAEAAAALGHLDSTEPTTVMPLKAEALKSPSSSSSLLVSSLLSQGHKASGGGLGLGSHHGSSQSLVVGFRGGHSSDHSSSLPDKNAQLLS